MRYLKLMAQIILHADRSLSIFNGSMYLVPILIFEGRFLVIMISVPGESISLYFSCFRSRGSSKR